jgi:hypothetical protein
MRVRRKGLYRFGRGAGKALGEKVTDLHKHYVDKLVLKCEECGGEMHGWRRC